MRHILLATLLSTAVFAQTEGKTDSLPKNPGTFKIDSIQYEIGDAFDDSKYHTKYDKWAYDFLNWIHIETRESTVRKLLLFNQGDTVDSIMLQESERFLRTQRYLSDASIRVENEDGKNVAHVKTSDNWTLVVPAGIGFGGKEWSYKNLNWSLGIQEGNFLGLGQRIEIIYIHEYFRDTWKLDYSAPHFLFRYNKLDLTFANNTDGYLASWQMYVPFMNRNQNQWAYTLAGLKNKRTIHVFGSGDLPPGAVPYETSTPLDSLPKYNGKETVTLMRFRNFAEDSLSLHFSRSFGDSKRKLYVGATYDYLRQEADRDSLFLKTFRQGDQSYIIDTPAVWNDWAPEVLDSRLGLYLTLSNLYYVKEKNLNNVKWTEDVEKGYSIKAQVSKNYKQLGSENNDIRIDLWANLYLGRNMHHLNLSSRSRFYLDHWQDIHDFYGRVYGEYIFHPTQQWSTVLKGQIDFYKNANYGYQLSLGGSDGFAGFDPGYYTGQARVYGFLEQRYFPNFEIATLRPVLAVFGTMGETAWDIKNINRKDLVYVLGFGLRLAQTKSTSRLVNKIDINIPLNGARKGDIHYSVTTTTNL
ncbi:MAG: hypothetical protein HUK19_03180 [Fibrobacter sp.]|nr:hypothetical protein [Fibrobacter sp.]